MNHFPRLSFHHPISRGGLAHFCLCALLLYSALVQHPAFRQSGTHRLVAIVLWATYGVVCLAMAIGTRHFVLNRAAQFAIAALVATVVHAALMGLASGQGMVYLSSTLMRVFSLSFCCFFTGYASAYVVTRRQVWISYCIYGLALCCVSASIGSSDVSVTLEGINKNSWGITLTIGVLILAPNVVEGRWATRWFWLAATAVLVWNVLFSGNRSSMVSLGVVATYVLLWRRSSVFDKTLLVLVLSGLVAYTIVNRQYSERVQQSLGTERLDTHGFDQFTGGRVSQAEFTLRNVRKNPFLGVGPTYVECFHFAALLQFGLLGMIPIWWAGGIALRRFVFSRQGWHSEDALDRTLATLLVHGAVVSCFEELAPFGPGFTWLALWLLFGYVAAPSTNTQSVIAGKVCVGHGGSLLSDLY